MRKRGKVAGSRAWTRMKPRRIRLREQLVLHLAEEIIAGRLAVGETFPAEPELARTFGISKVVLREAIQELASHGLLRVQHGKHTKVLEQSFWNVLAQPVQAAYRQSGAASDLTEQLYDVRLILELSAVSLATEHRSRDDLRELDALVESMRVIAKTTRDVSTFLVSDRAFHDVIGRATGNMVLRAMMRDLHNLLAANWNGSHTLPAQLEFLAEQHAAIAEIDPQPGRPHGNRQDEGSFAVGQEDRNRADGRGGAATAQPGGSETSAQQPAIQRMNAKRHR